MGIITCCSKTSCVTMIKSLKFKTRDAILFQAAHLGGFNKKSLCFGKKFIIFLAKKDEIKSEETEE
jgi:hypothetical protein